MGSDFDTVLVVLASDCAGAELACDDDSGGEAAGDTGDTGAGGFTLDSEVSLALSAGDVVVVSVGGFGCSTGTYVLNINR